MNLTLSTVRLRTCGGAGTLVIAGGSEEPWGIRDILGSEKEIVRDCPHDVLILEIVLSRRHAESW